MWDNPFDEIGIDRLDNASSSQKFRPNNRFHKYLSEYIEALISAGNCTSAVFAEITESGTLVQLFGNSDVCNALNSHDIHEGLNFLDSYYYSTAIYQGITQQSAQETIGNKNGPAELKDYAIYYQPVVFQDILEYSSQPATIVGGIAVFVLAKEQSPLYRSLITSIVLGVVRRMSSTVLTHSYLSLLDVFRLSFFLSKDNSSVPLIDSFTDSVFSMMGIPVQDYYLHPLTEIIDPLPENKKFWEAVHNRTSFKSKELVITINGKRQGFIASLMIYEQPQLELNAGNLFLKTSDWITNMLTLQDRTNIKQAFLSVIGNSKVMEDAIQRGMMLSQVRGNIMLLGESGTGKEVFANAIHNASSRCDKPFIAINCGAMPSDLINSELFGYESGSFTGANRNGKIGKFEQANGGTLFLDEVGELPLDQQVVLLRAVEQKKITRLGGNKEINVDVRIICATNEDLEQMIENKLFRMDLYYRLSTFRLVLPPLKERESDVILLAEYFLQYFASENSSTVVPVLTNAAKQTLLQQPWHGNVRELRNLMECLIFLYPGKQITPEMIYANMRMDHNFSAKQTIINKESSQMVNFTQVPRRRNSISESQICQALDLCNGNRSAAAKMLKISRPTLYSYLNRYGIQ